MTCNKTVYIDGSGSVGGLPFSMLEVGTLYQDDQWQVFEFASNVRAFNGRSLMGDGTHIGRLTDFIIKRHEWHKNVLLDTVVVITDENIENEAWFELKEAGVHVYQVTDAASVPLPGTSTVHCSSRNKVFTCTAPVGGGRCKFCGLYITGPEVRRAKQDHDVRERIMKWYIAVDNLALDARYISDPMQDPSKYGMHGHYVPYNFTIPSRPQEAHMSYNNKPSIVTSVTLARPHGNEQVIISDLKALIAEVERVGGDDTSVVALGNDNRTWNVTLTVKANEVEREVEVTDEERLALLDEHTTATKTRKAEIKTLLGL